MAAKVDRLLEHSRVEAIVANRGRAFTRQVALMAGDLTDAELERLVPAVQEAFAAPLLRSDIASFVVSEAPNDATVDEVLRFLDSGANAELRRLADANPPEGTLEDYLRERMQDPPDPERVERITRWVDTQAAGEFYVLLDQALSESAHAVWATLRADAPPFEPLEGTVLDMQLNDSFNASVVTFLRAFESVPDSVLTAATDEYATDAGQWYVHTYSLAVAQAMRSAGARAVATLGG